MKKRKKTYRSFLLRIGLIFVVLIGIYIAFIYFIDRTDPLTHSEEIPPADRFVYQGEPLIQMITRWHKEENLALSTINNQLPAPYKVLVLDEDITANGAPNYIIKTADNQLPEPAAGLINAGFTHVFRELVVYEARKRTLYPVLTIDSEAIRNGYGEQLIDQITAQYGYALVLETYEHEELYDQPVELLEIVMLNEAGHEISDDIVLYWDPSEETYKATNIFGAP